MSRKVSGLMCLIISLIIFNFASFASAAGLIENLAETVNVNNDASLTISEIWRYDFGFSNTNQIERSLPSYNIKNVHVYDDNGELKADLSTQGQRLLVKINSKGSPFSGSKNFRITYTIDKALIWLEKNRANLNWEVSGSWPVDIISADAKIIFPMDVTDGQLISDCVYGDPKQPYKCQSQISKKDGQTIVEVSNASTLSAGGILKVNLTFPSTGFDQPGLWDKFRLYTKDYWSWLLIFFALMLARIWSKTWPKNPRSSGAYGLRYTPPNDLTPMETAAVLRKQIDKKALAAEIFHLANKGQLTVELMGGERGTDYFLKTQHPPTRMDNDHESYILESLFGDRREVSLSVYAAELPEVWPRLLSLMRLNIKQKNLNNNKAILSKIFTILFWLLITFLGIKLGDYFKFQSWMQNGFSSFGAVLTLFSLFKPAYSRNWMEMIYGLKGFEHYLSDKSVGLANTQNASPVKNSDLFENYLPYALALDVGQAWANQFVDLELSKPAWYINPYHKEGVCDPKILADDLATFAQVLNDESPI